MKINRKALRQQLDKILLDGWVNEEDITLIADKVIHLFQPIIKQAEKKQN
jgi:hypothetical protein